MEPEGTIKFILDQQARLAAGMVELQIRQNQFQSELDGLRSVVATVVTVQQSFGETLRQLAEAQQRIAEAQQRTEASLLATDERLNALIQIVDGIVRRPPRP